MTRLLQTLLDSVTVGSLYGLIALGYTMVYGILQFINFAHSDVFMLGAWFSYTISKKAGWQKERPPVWSAPFVLFAAMAICGLIGFTIERLAYKPLRRAPRLNVLITAIGVSLFIENTGQLNDIWIPFFSSHVWVGTPAAEWKGAGAAPGHRADFELGSGARVSFLGSSSGPFRGDDALAAAAKVTETIDVPGGMVTLYEAARPSGKLLVAALPVRDETWSAWLEGPAAEVERQKPVLAAWAKTWHFWGPLHCFGTQPQSMPPLIEDRVLFSVLDQEVTDPDGTKHVEPGVQLRLVNVIVISVAVALMVILQWLVYGTKLGLGMRAVAFDTRTASLMGVNADRVISFTFVVGSALAAAAGLLFSLKYSGLKQPADQTWVLLGLKAFVAAVVGGIGNVRGAVVGGLLIGLLEECGVAYLSPTLRDVYVFALLIVVLLVRPTGIFGKRAAEKV